MKKVLSWILTIIFAIVIIYECVNIFSNGNSSAGNIAILVIAFILTFISSTVAKVQSRK